MTVDEVLTVLAKNAVKRMKVYHSSDYKAILVKQVFGDFLIEHRKGWADYNPQVVSEEAGPEPSIRQVIKFFYEKNDIPDDMATALTDSYIRQMENKGIVL